MKGRTLFWILLALALFGCGPKRICSPPCNPGEKCVPAWTESSGPFGGGYQESQESVCKPDPNADRHCKETCPADQHCVIVGGSTIGQEWGCRCKDGFYQAVKNGPCLPMAPGPGVPPPPPPEGR